MAGSYSVRQPGRQRHASCPPPPHLSGVLVSLSDDECNQLIPGVSQRPGEMSLGDALTLLGSPEGVP